MLSFIHRYKGALAGALIFLASIVLLCFPAFDDVLTGRARMAALDILPPVQRVFSSALEKIYAVWDHYIFLRDMKEENEDLRRLVEELSTKYDNLKTLYIENEKKNERLEAVLGFTKVTEYRLMPARVIGRDPSITSSSIVIDKGLQDGVKQDMAVISPNGIVGIVLTVSHYSSRVMLINDKNSRIDCLIQDNRTMGILEGSTDGSVKLLNIDRKVPVAIGDMVITAGMGGIFPKGLQVGEVVEVQKPISDMFLEIMVEPKTDLSSLEEVLLIVQ